MQSKQELKKKKGKLFKLAEVRQKQTLWRSDVLYNTIKVRTKSREYACFYKLEAGSYEFTQRKSRTSSVSGAENWATELG